MPVKTDGFGPPLRAAYQVDVARAQLQAGDATAPPGRAVLAAERIAAAEVRCRPAVREVLGAVLRSYRQPRGLARLFLSGK